MLPRYLKANNHHTRRCKFQFSKIAFFFALLTPALFDIEAQAPPGGVGGGLDVQGRNVGVAAIYPTHSWPAPANMNPNVAVNYTPITTVQCATATTGAIVQFNVVIGTPGTSVNQYTQSLCVANATDISNWNRYLDGGSPTSLGNVWDAFWLEISSAGQTRYYRLRPSNNFTLLPSDGPVCFQYPVNANPPCDYAVTLRLIYSRRTNGSANQNSSNANAATTTQAQTVVCSPTTAGTDAINRLNLQFTIPSPQLDTEKSLMNASGTVNSYTVCATDVAGRQFIDLTPFRCAGDRYVQFEYQYVTVDGSSARSITIANSANGTGDMLAGGTGGIGGTAPTRRDGGTGNPTINQTATRTGVSGGASNAPSRYIQLPIEARHGDEVIVKMYNWNTCDFEGRPIPNVFGDDERAACHFVQEARIYVVAAVDKVDDNQKFDFCFPAPGVTNNYATPLAINEEHGGGVIGSGVFRYYASNAAGTAPLTSSLTDYFTIPGMFNSTFDPTNSNIPEAHRLIPNGTAAQRRKVYWVRNQINDCYGEPVKIEFRVRDDISAAPVITSASPTTLCEGDEVTYSVMGYTAKVPATTGDDVSYVWLPGTGYTIVSPVANADGLHVGYPAVIKFNGASKNPTVRVFRMWTTPVSNPPNACPTQPIPLPPVGTNLCPSCFSQTGSLNITINELPTGTLSGGGEICGDKNATLTIGGLTGSTGAYNVTISRNDGGSDATLNDIYNGQPYPVTQAEGTDVIYTITKIEAAAGGGNNCINNVTAPTPFQMVEVIKRQTLSLVPYGITTDPNPLCENVPFYVELTGLDMTAFPNTELIWTYNATQYPTSDNHETIASAGSSTMSGRTLSVVWRYNTAAAGDYCATAPKSTTVMVNRGPTATVDPSSLNQTVCENTDAKVNIILSGGTSGEDYIVAWEIEKDAGVVVAGVPAVFSATPGQITIDKSLLTGSASGEYQFKITSVTRDNSCDPPALSNNTAKITVEPTPTAKFADSDISICEGLEVSVDIKLTGAPLRAYNINYQIGNDVQLPITTTTSASTTPTHTLKIPVSYITAGTVEVKINSVSQMGGLSCVNDETDVFTINVEAIEQAEPNPDGLEYYMCGDALTPTPYKIPLKGKIPTSGNYSGEWIITNPNPNVSLEPAPYSGGADVELWSNVYDLYMLEWRIVKDNNPSCYSSKTIPVSFSQSQTKAEVLKPVDQICYNINQNPLLPPQSPYELQAVRPKSNEHGLWEIWGIELDNGSNDVYGGITWSLQSGTLPPGLSLNPITGVISGKPETTAAGNTYSFTVEAENFATPAQTQTLTPIIAIAPATGGTLPVGTAGAPYSVNLITTLPQIPSGWGSIVNPSNFIAEADVRDYGKYTFLWTVSGGCGSDYAFSTITFNPKPVVKDINMSPICADDEILFDDFVALNPLTQAPLSGSLTYYWAFDPAKIMSTFADIPNGTGQMSAITPKRKAPPTAGNAWERYNVEVEVETASCRSDKMIFTIEVKPKPKAVTLQYMGSEASNFAVCSEEEITLGLSANMWQNTIYEWTYTDDSTVGVDDYVIDTSTGGAARPNYSVGQYDAGEEEPPYLFKFKTKNGTADPVIATFENVTATVNGCTGNPVDLTLTVNPRPVLTAPKDIEECPQDEFGAPTTIIDTRTTVVSTVPAPDTEYTWNWGGPNIGFSTSGVTDDNLGNFIFPANTGSGRLGGTMTVTGSAYGCVSEPVSFEIWVKSRPNINQPANQSLCPVEQSDGTFSGVFNGITFRSGNLADGQVNYNWTITPPPPSFPSGTGTGSTPVEDARKFNDNTTSATITYTWNLTATGAAGSPADGCVSKLATPFTFNVYPRPVIAINNPNVPVCSGAPIFDDISFETTNTPSSFSWNITPPPASDGNVTTGASALWGGSSAPVQFSGKPYNTASVASLGSDTYEATITVNAISTNGCVATPATTKLYVKQAPVMNIPDAIELCSGEEYKNLSEFSTYNDVPNVEYYWDILDETMWKHGTLYYNYSITADSRGIDYEVGDIVVIGAFTARVDDVNASGAIRVVSLIPPTVTVGTTKINLISETPTTTTSVLGTGATFNITSVHIPVSTLSSGELSFEVEDNLSAPAVKWATEIEVWAKNTDNDCLSEAVKFPLTVRPQMALTSSVDDIIACPNDWITIPSFTSNVYGSDASMINWKYEGVSEKDIDIALSGYFIIEDPDSPPDLIGRESGGNIPSFYAAANPPPSNTQIIGKFTITVGSDWSESLQKCTSETAEIVVKINPTPEAPTLDPVPYYPADPLINPIYYYCHSDVDEKEIKFLSTPASTDDDYISYISWTSNDASFTGVATGTNNPLVFKPENNSANKLVERSVTISAKTYAGEFVECPSSSTVFDIIVRPVPRISETFGDYEKCSGELFEIPKFTLHSGFKASDYDPSDDQTIYNWEISKVGTWSGTDLPDLDDEFYDNPVPPFTPVITGSDQRIMKLSVTPVYETCPGVEKIVDIIINPLPKITITNNPAVPLCSGESFGTVSFDSGGVPSDFYWELPEPPTGISTGLPTGAGSGTNYNSTEEIYYGNSSSITFGETSYEVNSSVNSGSERYSPKLTLTVTASGTGCETTEEIELTVLQVPVLAPLTASPFTYCSYVSLSGVFIFNTSNGVDVGKDVTTDDGYTWSVVNTVGGNVWTTAPTSFGVSREEGAMPDFTTVTHAGPANREATFSVVAHQFHLLDDSDTDPDNWVYKICDSKSEEFTVIVRPKLTISPQTTPVTVCPGETVLPIAPIVNETDVLQVVAWVFTDDSPSIVVDSSNPLDWDPTVDDIGSGLTREFKAADNNSVYNPAGNALTGTFEFTVRYDNGPTCESEPVDYSVVVNPTPADPVFTNLPSFCHEGESEDAIILTPAGADFEWWWETSSSASQTANITGTGIPAKGIVSSSGNIPKFKIFNETTAGGNYRYGTGVVTITANASKDGCPAENPAFLTLEVNPVAQMTRPENISICAGATHPGIVFAWDAGYFPADPANDFKWSITETTWFEESDLHETGDPEACPEDESGNLPPFTPKLPATSTTPKTMIWSVTPIYKGCPGIAQTGMTITVNPMPILSVSGATLKTGTTDEWEQERCSDESKFKDMAITTDDIDSGFEWKYSQWPGLWNGVGGGEISSGVVIPGSATISGPVSTVQNGTITFNRNPLYTSEEYGTPTASPFYSSDISIKATADVGGCVAEGKITLTVKQAPVMQSIDNIIACSSEVVEVPLFEVLNGVAVTEYDWEINRSDLWDKGGAKGSVKATENLEFETIAPPSATNNKAVIEVSSIHPATLCASDTVKFELTVRSVPTVTSSNPDRTVCSGGDIDFGAFVTAPVGETEVYWVLDDVAILATPIVISGSPFGATGRDGTGAITPLPFKAADNTGATASDIIGEFELYPRYTSLTTTANPSYCGLTVPSKTIKVTVKPAPDKPVLTAKYSSLVFCDGTGTASELSGAGSAIGELEILKELGLSAGADEVKWEWTGVGGTLLGTGGNSGSNTIPAFTINNTTVKDASMSEPFDQLGTGLVTFTLTPWKGACEGEKETFVVTVNPFVRMTITDAYIDMCSGSSTTLPEFNWNVGNHYNATTASNYDFEWEYSVSGATFDDTDIDDSGGATNGKGQLQNNSGNLPPNEFEPYLDPSSNSNGIINITVTPLYTANGLECPGAIEYATINVRPAPVFKIDGSDDDEIIKRICSGNRFSTIQLSYVGEEPDFVWSFGTETPYAPVTSGVGHSTQTLASGRYTVEGTSEITFLNDALFSTANTDPLLAGFGDVYEHTVSVMAISRSSVGCVSPPRSVILEVYREPEIAAFVDDIEVCSNADYPDTTPPLLESAVEFEEKSGRDSFVSKYIWTIGGVGNPDKGMWSGAISGYEDSANGLYEIAGSGTDGDIVEMPLFKAYSNNSLTDVTTEISVTAISTYTIPITPTTDITLNCRSKAETFDYTVRPLPVLITLETEIPVCDNYELVPSSDFPALAANTGAVRWEFDDIDGIIASSTYSPSPYPTDGNTTIPGSFTVSGNSGTAAAAKKGVFTLFPQINDGGKVCEGESRTITVIVHPTPDMPLLVDDPTNTNPTLEYCHGESVGPIEFTSVVKWDIVAGSDDINLPDETFDEFIDNFTIQNNTVPNKYDIGVATINVQYYDPLLICPSAALPVIFKVKPVVQIDPSYVISSVCDFSANTPDNFIFDPVYSALHGGNVGTASDFEWEITSYDADSNLPQSSVGLNPALTPYEDFGYLPAFTPTIGGSSQIVMDLIVTPYYRDAENECPGKESEPISIIINPKPIINLTADSAEDEERCSGTTAFNFIEFESDVPSNFSWLFPKPPTSADIDTRVSNVDKTPANIVTIGGDDYYPGTGERINFTGIPVYTTAESVYHSATTPGYYEAEIIVKAESVAAACEADDITTTITLKQAPVLAVLSPTYDIEACHGESFVIPLTVTNETPLEEYKWTVSNTDVGLSDGASATTPLSAPYSDVINYTATNTTSNDNPAVVEVIAEHENGCFSAPEEFNIIVRPTPVLSQLPASIDRCANETITAGVDLDLVQYNPTPTSMNPSLHWELDDETIITPSGSITPSGTSNGSGGLTGTGNISELITGNLTSAATGTFTFTARIAKTTTSGTLTYCESEPAELEVNVFAAPVQPVLAASAMPLFTGGTPPVLVTCIGNVPSIPIETSTATGDVKFSWKNTATDVIGLPTPQTLVPGTPAVGPPPTTQFDFPAFTATNSNLTAASANIEVTASITTSSGECSSSPLKFDIKVQPRAQLGDWATPEICSEDEYVPADITDPADPALFVFSSAFNAVNGDPNASPNPAHFKWEIQGYNAALFGTPALAASDDGYLPAFQPTGITGSTATQLTLRVTPIWEGCDGTPKDYTINLNPLPIVTPAYLSSTVCSGKEFDDLGISLSPNIANSTYEWAIDPTTLPAPGSTITTGIIVPSSPVSAGPITFGASSNTEQSSYTATLNITATTPVSCTGSADVLLTITQAPVVTPLSDIDVCAENIVDAVDFATYLPPADIAGYTWTINNPSVRHDQLAGADSLAMRKFTAKVSGASDNNAKVTVYATHVNGCQSLPEEFDIKVRRIPTLIAIGSQERCPGETVGPLTLSLNFIPAGLVDLEITWTLDNDDIIKDPSAFPPTLSGTSNSLPFNIPSFITADNPDDGSHTPIIGTFNVIGTMTWGTGANEFCNFTNPIQPIVITVNPVPESPFITSGLNWNNKTLFCNGETVMETHFESHTQDVTYSWKQISGDLIGLPLNNLDYIPEFTAVNNTPGRLDAGVAKILITATSEKGCMSDAIDMEKDIIVKPVPQLDVYEPIILCAGETYDGNANPFEIKPEILVNYAPAGVTPESFVWRISSGWLEESDLPDGGTASTPNWTSGNIDGMADPGSFTFTPDTTKTGSYPNYYKPGSTTEKHPFWGGTSFTFMNMTVVPSYADCEGEPALIDIIIYPLPVTKIQLATDPCLDAGATKIYMSNEGVPEPGSLYGWELEPDPLFAPPVPQPIFSNQLDSLFFAAVTFPDGMGNWKGTLSLTEKNLYQCEGQKVSTPIMIVPMPNVSAGAPIELCFGDSTQMNASVINETDFDMSRMHYEWGPYNIFMDYNDATTNLEPWVLPITIEETIVRFRAIYSVENTPYECPSEWVTTTVWALPSPEPPTVPRVIVCEADDEMLMDADISSIKGIIHWQRLVETYPGSLQWDETETVDIDNSAGLNSISMRDRVNHANALPYSFILPDDPLQWGAATNDTTIYFQTYQITDVTAPSSKNFPCKSTTSQTQLIINRTPEPPEDLHFKFCEDINNPFYTLRGTLQQGSNATSILWYDDNNNYLGAGDSRLVNQTGHSYPDGGSDAPFIFYLTALSSANCESLPSTIEMTIYQNPVLEYELLDQFGATTTGGCSPFELTAFNKSTNNDVEYRWLWSAISDDIAPIGSLLPHIYYVEGSIAETIRFQFEGVSTVNIDDASGKPCTTLIPETITVAPGVVADFIVSQTEGCHPTTVKFISDSKTKGAYAFRWFWDEPVEPSFPPPAGYVAEGDLAPNPEKIFTNTDAIAKEYRVWLQADNGMCFDNKDTIITVYPTPTADFYMDNLINGGICPPQPVEFSVNQSLLGASNDPLLTNYTWSYGDGFIDTTLVNNRMSHIYSNWVTEMPDRKTVRLTTFNTYYLNGGLDSLICSSFVTQELMVNPELEARFTGDVEGCSPFEAQFMNQSIGMATSTSFHWDFGDGNIEDVADPKNTFVNNQNSNMIIDYPVTLTARNNWCSHQTNGIFRLYPKPAVKFSVDNTSGCQPFDVRFLNTSTGNMDNTRYYYDFNDGYSQEVFNTNPVTHIYTNSLDADLNITPALTAKNVFLSLSGLAGDSVSCTSNPATLRITVFPYIKADFTVDVNDINRCSPLDVTLFNGSQGYDTYEYTWNGGGYLPGDKTSSAVSDIRLTADNMFDDKEYELFLKVNMGVCSDMVSHKVLVNASPIADFRPASPYPSSYPYDPAFPTQIQFDNLIQPPNKDRLNYLWSWNEHDLNYLNHFSTSINPPRLFLQGWGKFDLIQQVTSPNGVCSDSKLITIEIIPPTPTPAFEDIAPACMPYEVQFTNTSRFAKAYLWEFDDGDHFSTEQNPKHTFMRAGTYNVKLTVYGEDMSSASTVKQIIVHSAPQAGFELKSKFLYVGMPVQTWNYTKHDTPVSYEWDWGDDMPADTTATPSHMYLKPGTYNVTLTACSYSLPACCSTFPLYNAITLENLGDIILPNIFVPEAEGEPSDVINPSGYKNNLFYPPVLSPTSQYKMTIVNRAGVLMYQTNDRDRGWNGYYKGNICPEDVYVYRIEGVFEDGKPFLKIGDVTLLR